MKIKLIILAVLCLFISAQKHIGGQLQEAALENRNADPSVGNIPGRMYWNTSANEFRVYNGSAYEAFTPPSPNAVDGPGSSTPEAIAFFEGASGKEIKSTNMYRSTVGQLGGVVGTSGNIFIPDGGMVVENATGSGNYNATFRNKAPGTNASMLIDQENPTANSWALRVEQAGTTDAININHTNSTTNSGYGIDIRSQAPNQSGMRVKSANWPLRLEQLSAVRYVRVGVENVTTSWDLQLPPDAGTSGQVLQTDGSGVTDWVDGVVGPGDGVVENNTLAVFSGTTGKLLRGNSNWKMFLTGLLRGVTEATAGNTAAMKVRNDNSAAETVSKLIDLEENQVNTAVNGGLHIVTLAIPNNPPLEESYPFTFPVNRGGGTTADEGKPLLTNGFGRTFWSSFALPLDNGTAGQVITSAGNGTSTWENAALDVQNGDPGDCTVSGDKGKMVYNALLEIPCYCRSFGGTTEYTKFSDNSTCF